MRNLSIRDPNLLTTRQVADMLGVHADTVRNYRNRGYFPHVRLPGNNKAGMVRYRLEDIQAWIDSQAQNEMRPLPGGKPRMRNAEPKSG